MRIAIDGPAAAGKSTVAKMIAKRLGYVYIDTGAMYRALTLAALESNIDVDDEHSLTQLAEEIAITFKNDKDGQEVYINEHDVTKKIRDKDVTNNVSMVAKHQLVREKLVDMQRSLAREGNVVMDGRDIGTFVLPNAELKVFLIASVEERALRRHKENLENGFESDLEQLKEEIRKRDQLDSEREVAPLVKADDAIEIDTTNKSIDDVADTIYSLAQSRK
ncbi:(d)CMP kinase [Tenuibacillus multivorans]|uniref:Cytidylate kinase n=1 Tax=Tenuibacillus multivorans TaxID=237069 RepID=A0A1H0CW16_9BACI|nr:(d)CMP kinase [Tenuibacillus multivorans]GEL76142.1 cytidylate kinase [Tenuibacillus multivorans]SDN62084.1 cytidylate kinase [Tenuibacillus multivorans]